MDARVDGLAVTSRCGKPVEVQALWIHALAAGAAGAAGAVAPGPEASAARWRDLGERARASFAARFWNEAAGCLYDVVDVDHRRGAVDAAMRPNQVLAVGGLPAALLPPGRGRRVGGAGGERRWAPPGARAAAPR